MKTNNNNKQKGLRYMLAIMATIIVGAMMAMLFVWLLNGRIDSKESYKLLRDGQRCFYKGELTVAFGKLQLAYENFKKLDDKDGLFETVVYIGMAYDQIGQQEQAYKVMSEMEFRDVKPYKYYSSQYYLRMMSYYMLSIKKDYKRAYYFNERAIKFSKEKYPNDTVFIYTDLSNRVELLMSINEYDKAWKLINELERAKPIKQDIYKSQLYYCRGKLQEKMGETDSAYNDYKQSLVYSQKHFVYDNLMNALEKMCSIDSIRGDYQLYFEHHNRLNSIKEKIRGSEVYYKIAVLQEQNKLEMVRRKSQQSRTINMLTLTIMGGTVIALLVVLMLLRKSQRAQQRLSEAEKQRLDAEVAREKMKKELLRLKMEKREELLDKAYKENVAMGLKLIGTEGVTDKLVPLERTVTEIDKQFIERFEKQYPTISRNDMRLISYIRMGMASYEISTILNITMPSLHKARYRLRKKLGLSQEQDLDKFVREF
ncbi:MAG: hypothetical protein ACI4TW_00980 [Prevotella sp.]